ncbi:DUF6236 family protein [Vogesella sp. DC21W]|uniref:DUF6236 family protein n=1 Tax=Vogesella aquatica TaxID=2984206 RepID=A0ABT5IW90_9NEIS|nr:DUF6236 family protein [Vogesella aquatica]MDC7716816.1 DUF6236 family protein [Vogesella aquatica]
MLLSERIEQECTMGESRRRKLSEPSYGKRPQGGRGIMLVPFFHENGTRTETAMAANLCAKQLRFGLLFWDRIAWPSLPYFLNGENGDTDFLSSAGVLLRPEIQLRPTSMSVGKCLAEAYFRAFQELEEKEPGRWSMSAETEADIKTILGDHIASDRGITVSLHRAIPIPTGDTPLQDLLEFKQKREAELLRLRAELDGCKQLITGYTDRAEAFATQRDRIDAACRDLLVVSREMKLPVRIADISMAFEVNGTGIAATAAAVASLYNNLNLTSVQTFLASLGLFAATNMKFTTTFGTKKSLIRNSPFRYVHHLHEELDWC